MRFDMRAPQPGASTGELYASALEMATWAEGRGCPRVLLCEHHASPDGYLPSPLILGSAMAARTRDLGITLVLLLPFYDPVRLAEDMNVLDIVSHGRVAYIFGVGYRPEEFEHFGVDRGGRGRAAEAKLELLQALLAGEPVVRGGRRIHVTPPPSTPGGPPIAWGGSSLAAARRAGRFGLAYSPNGSIPGLQPAMSDTTPVGAIAISVALRCCGAPRGAAGKAPRSVARRRLALRACSATQRTSAAARCRASGTS